MIPIKLDIGFIHLHDYEGMYFFIAILAAVLYLSFLCKEESIDFNLIFEALLISLVAAIVCGRLFSLLFWDTKNFLQNPLIFLQVWKGGITVAGGVLGGLVCGFVYAKVKKLDFFYYIQFFVPAIIIGHIIGCFGCFLNGDAAGLPTSLPWAIHFPQDSIAYATMELTPGEALHPAQLYEIFGNIIFLLFIILTGNNGWIKRRRIAWYTLGYSTIRFIVESFRNDVNRWEWLPVFTTGQIICLIGMAIGLLLLAWTVIFKDKFNQPLERNANLKKELTVAGLFIAGGLSLEVLVALTARLVSQLVS